MQFTMHRFALAAFAAAAIIDSIRDLTKLRGEVLFTSRGSLPSGGKIIDDVREYD